MTDVLALVLLDWDNLPGDPESIDSPKSKSKSSKKSMARSLA